MSRVAPLFLCGSRANLTIPILIIVKSVQRSDQNYHRKCPRLLSRTRAAASLRQLRTGNPKSSQARSSPAGQTPDNIYSLQDRHLIIKLSKRSNVHKNLLFPGYCSAQSSARSKLAQQGAALTAKELGEDHCGR